MSAKYKRTSVLAQWSNIQLRVGSSICDRTIRDRNAVRYDQRGASQGTGQSWHGQRYCQEAMAVLARTRTRKSAPAGEARAVR